MALTRNDFVEQSVQTLVKREVNAAYPGKVEFVERFDHERMEGLATNFVASGFDGEQDGVPAEMGSDLVTRPYFIEFFVVGQTRTWGRNLAHFIKQVLERDGIIPLLDLETPGFPPTADALEVIGATVEHEIVPEPEPWQHFIFTVRLQVEDTYYLSAVLPGE